MGAGVLDKVESVLHIQLKDYEIQERCTEVVVHDGSNLGLVRKFIATKRLEGKSEKALEKYQRELEKLVGFLRSFCGSKVIVLHRKPWYNSHKGKTKS